MNRLLLWLGALSIYVPVVLVADNASTSRQMFLGAVTLLVLVALVRSLRVDRTSVALAIIIATAGEIILSIGWGLYSYRDAIIPLYVPFGHGIFYAIAVATAAHTHSLKASRYVVPAVVTAASVYAVASALFAGDAWGLIWWVVAATLIVRSRNARLLAICCLFTMLLEWVGTGLGNWTWVAIVPGLGLGSANPPSGVGLLYVVLDLVTVKLAAMRWPRTRPAAATS